MHSHTPLAALKLLFDQNLSPRLVRRLADLYPGSAHVRDFGLERSDDEPIWQYAAAEGFAVVTKDDDFRQRSFMRGAPPKVFGSGWETALPLVSSTYYVRATLT